MSHATGSASDPFSLSETFETPASQQQQLSPFPSWSADYGETTTIDVSPFHKLDDDTFPFCENQPSPFQPVNLQSLSHQSNTQIFSTHTDHQTPPTSTNTLYLPIFVSSVPAITVQPNSPVIHPTPVRAIFNDASAHQPSLSHHSDDSKSALQIESTSSNLFSPASTLPPTSVPKSISTSSSAQILVKTRKAPASVAKTAVAKVTSTRAKRVPKSEPKPVKPIPQKNPLPSNSTLNMRELRSRLARYERLFDELDTMMTNGQVSLETRLKNEIHDIVQRKIIAQVDQFEVRRSFLEQRDKTKSGSHKIPTLSGSQQLRPVTMMNSALRNENDNDQSSFHLPNQFHYSDQRLSHQQPLPMQQQPHPSMLSRQIDLNSVLQLQQRQANNEFSSSVDEPRYLSYPQQDYSSNSLGLTDSGVYPAFDPRGTSPFKKRKMDHNYSSGYSMYSQPTTVPYNNNRYDELLPSSSSYTPYLGNHLTLPASADLNRAVQYRPMSRQGSEHSDITAFQHLQVNNTPAISFSSSNQGPYFTRF